MRAFGAGEDGSTMDRSFTLEGTNKKGVLLIHGLTGTPLEMMFLAKRLNKYGFTIEAPQLAGHCQDEDALLATGWRDWIQSLRDAHDKLAARVDEVYVAGICAGGALGIALAAERPQIAGAAVYSMTFEYDGWNMPKWYRLAPLMWLGKVLPFLQKLRFGDKHPYGIKDKRLRERFEAAPEAVLNGSLPAMPLGALQEMYRLCKHVERVAHKVEQPTLIAHAIEDDLSNVRNAHRLEKGLSGPVKMLLLNDSYHMIHIDRERNLVADETARFFGAEREMAAVSAATRKVCAVEAPATPSPQTASIA